MTPPAWTDVPALMADWIADVNRLEPNAEQFPEAVAELHCRFERIHPFLDGNGRAGRLVLNLLLVRLGYPPAIIYKNQRRMYLAALRRADRGDSGPLGELIARAILDNLYKFVIPAVAGPGRLVPLQHWRVRGSPTRRCGRLRYADGYRPRAAPTGSGAAPAIGWRSTSRLDTCEMRL